MCFSAAVAGAGGAAVPADSGKRAAAGVEAEGGA